jgi:uncharacterized protein (TIGR03435 family)
MRRIGLCTLVMLVPPLAFGQAAPTNPAFEVVSVKPSAPGGSGGGITPGPTSLTAKNVTLLFCIRIAYDVQDYQVSGPNWLTWRRTFPTNAATYWRCWARYMATMPRRVSNP